ncbi:MAG: heparinase II/III family protein, partial [Ignavibacteria bacterium]
MKENFKKFKIGYIHFIKKTVFIFRVKSSSIFYPKKFQTLYFLDDNKFYSNEYVQHLKNIETIENIINEANLVLVNKFQTLGSGLVNLGDKINWHQDFKSSRIWKKEFYTKIDSKHSINGSDIKIPWELSRFHQAQWLAKAFLISNDEIYAEKFFELLSHWIDENPFCYGVNWNCAMEVAIRAVNWIFALHIFKLSKYFSNEIKEKIYKSLYQHGLFIRNNLEFGRRNGNHYLSDLMGLIWLGAFFFNHSFGKKWFRFAQKELEKENQIQVYDDGV